MWSTQEALIGSQCEYANAPVNSLTDPVMPSYLRSGFHCAIRDSNPGFGKGEHCGKCYRLTSLNDDGVSGTPGSKGSAVVMVSNGGAGGDAHFDCILESFQEITGAATGIFDIEFEQVVCADVTGTPVVINWADQNAHYCKMMFENVVVGVVWMEFTCALMEAIAKTSPYSRVQHGLVAPQEREILQHSPCPNEVTNSLAIVKILGHGTMVHDAPVLQISQARDRRLHRRLHRRHLDACKTRIHGHQAIMFPAVLVSRRC